MPLAKVKRWAQVTLPVSFRKKFHVVEGDYVKFEEVKEGLLVKPVQVIERQQALNDLVAIVDRPKWRNSEDAKEDPRKQEEWIAKQVKASRRHKVPKRHAS